MTNQLPQKPEKPKSDECCGGGSCCPCVWDEYKEKLATWRCAQNVENPTKKKQINNI
ncbi:MULTISPECIES: oxidoreductase-like domain-containing protein [unclassified Pseudoalteromonas]|uniref:oxidoreductase-like domain-containing protein n=1 Tax=unclassified Pseudoalteromonas TaxID=194690 RepID=UPI0013FD335E|nr:MULTISPECIES: oxidoreductase-like domain-containing protein [unclassified Pseudoalteromonas]